MARRQKRSDEGIPHITGDRGFFSSNIADHDGKIVIGSGADRFDTVWDYGGGNAVRAYNHGNNIIGVAVDVDRDAVDLDELSPAELRQLNFTSRVRSASAGKLVVYENDEGRFLAIIVRDIKSTGEQNIDVGFEYRIISEQDADDGIYPIDQPFPDFAFDADEAEEYENGEDKTSFLVTEDGSHLTDEDENRLVVEDNSSPKQLAFDLYAPYTPARAQDAAIDVRNRLTNLLVQIDATEVWPEITLGHNNPPPEFITRAEERRRLFDALGVVADLDASDRANREALWAAAKVVLAASRQVAQWTAAKLDQAADSFFQEIGSKAAWTVSIIAVWTVIGGDMAKLAGVIVKALTGS